MGLEELNESCGQNLGKNFGVPDIKRILDINYNNVLLHIPQQFLRGHLHLVEREPLLAEVFQGGSDVIDGVVDAEEAVVDFVEGLYLNGLILGVVLREVERELLRDALGVDGGRHLCLPLVEYRQYGIIDIVVEEDDALLG